MGRSLEFSSAIKSVKDWPEILAGDEVMTTALLDRPFHESHVLSIRGRP